MKSIVRSISVWVAIVIAVPALAQNGLNEGHVSEPSKQTSSVVPPAPPGSSVAKEEAREAARKARAQEYRSKEGVEKATEKFKKLIKDEGACGYDVEVRVDWDTVNEPESFHFVQYHLSLLEGVIIDLCQKERKKVRNSLRRISFKQAKETRYQYSGKEVELQIALQKTLSPELLRNSLQRDLGIDGRVEKKAGEKPKTKQRSGK